METTIARTTRAAETLANSIMILELIQSSQHIEGVEQTDMVELLASLVTATFLPAQA